MNMWGVRKSLGVRSLQAKIEERVLRRTGHVLRMENTRLTNRVSNPRGISQYPDMG